MLRDFFFGEKKILTLNTIFFHLALILLSFLFVWLFSHSTSFRYSFIGLDSAVFQVVGKYWAEGFIPYKDFFDHKGAIIYLINALGYAIYPRSGIMVPQIIFLYISCLFIWRTLGLFCHGGKKIFFFALTLFYYAAHYWEGNNCGEYTMPFLAASTYCFMRFIINRENICPPLYGFIYGISFGGCVLLRASNAMPTCCYVFLTAIFLLHAREFKNLWKNFLSFCAGFASIVLPFVIYFAAHDALYDMFYGTILFNTSYATQGKVEYELALRLHAIAVKLMPLSLLIFFSVLLLVRDVKNKLAWSGIFVGVMMAILLMNLRIYRHYYMTVVPIIPLLFVILKQSHENFKNVINSPRFSLKRFFSKVIIVSVPAYALVCYCMYSLPLIQYFSPKFISDENTVYAEEMRDIRQLQMLIPEDERKSFACWGNFYSTSHWILVTDMKPQERFFMNNSVLSLLDSRLKTEWFQTVNDTPILWILYGEPKEKKEKYKIDEHREDPDVERLLAEKYTLRGEFSIYDQIMKLYRLND